MWSSRYDNRNCVLCRIEGIFPENNCSDEAGSLQPEWIEAKEEDSRLGGIGLGSQVSTLPPSEDAAFTIPREGNPREFRSRGTSIAAVENEAWGDLKQLSAPLDARRMLGVGTSVEGGEGVRVWVTEAVQTPTPTSVQGTPAKRLMTIAEEMAV